MLIPTGHKDGRHKRQDHNIKLLNLKKWSDIIEQLNSIDKSYRTKKGITHRKRKQQRIIKLMK